MSQAVFRVGDVFQEMAKMPDNSVDAVICSPPFLALRSYLPSGHPQKHLEIGSEPTPAAFLTTLLALTREWRRILTPTGSLCVELGDTYSGSGGGGGDYDVDGWRDGQPRPTGSGLVNRGRKRAELGIEPPNTNGRKGAGWPLDKSLCLIPSLFAGSLAYGRNLLQPDDQLEPWRVRNLIVWHRPNPPVGALGDKVRPSTSYVTVACTAKDRWFDLDSERTPGNSFERIGEHRGGRKAAKTPDGGGYNHLPGSTLITHHPAGAPPLDCWLDAPDADVWTIPTASFSGAHYATFPPALPRRLINLMCPRQVCVVCGEPRRRLTKTTQLDTGRTTNGPRGGSVHPGEEGLVQQFSTRTEAQVRTIGWTDCECQRCPHGYQFHNCPQRCPRWRRGIVCDPFAGSGTTLQAASELGRDSIGIDLDRRNLELARQRLGMFLVEEDEVVV